MGNTKQRDGAGCYREGMKCTCNLQMKSKIHFEKNRFSMQVAGLGCIACRGGTVINIHVFLPLKVTVLLKITGQERGGEGALKTETRT